MAEAISPALRREVAGRAKHQCEYCRMPEAALLAGCEVDHIIGRKHGGLTDAANLALSCERCNRAKGTDVGSVIRPGDTFVRLFNPRLDVWHDHFQLDGSSIKPLTAIGEVTVRLLQLNAPDRVLQRQVLQAGGAYPLS
ncbi:MAG: HNH endonuclease [Verrucomicrobia bacterium]|nr:HNH endonuclease [Verrucomicrobiota bacterium]